MAAVDTVSKQGQGNGLTRDAAAKALANRGAEGDKLLEYLGAKTDEELAALKSIQDGDGPDIIFEYLKDIYDDDRGEVMQALNKLFPASCFKYGTLPDISLRSTTRPLTATELSQAGLGGCMKWVGREFYQKAVNNTLKEIHEHWQDAKDGELRGEARNELYVQLVLKGQPGVGKTSMAERMMMDAADNVGPTQLQNMLKRLVTYKLQYRMDFSQHPRLKDEQLGGLIRPAQAFALRVLYMFCHETGQSYADFIESLKQHEDQQSVALLLSDLRARHAIKAARAALLPEGCETVAFHMIMENFSSGFELGKEDQDQADSNVTWAKQLMQAQAWDLQFEDDLLLVTYVCTGTDADIGGGQTHVILLLSLFPEDLTEICADLQQRLLGKQVELPMLLKALVEWPLGHPSHFVCLMRAAAKLARQEGKPSGQIDFNDQMLEAGLKQVLGPASLDVNLQDVLNKALVDICKEESWDSWLGFDQGQLMKILMAHYALRRWVTLEQVVDSRYTLNEGSPAVMQGGIPLTFGMLGGLSLVVLQPNPHNVSQHMLVVPALAMKAYYDMAMENNWLSSAEQYMFEGMLASLQPDTKVEILTQIYNRAWAIKLLDGSGPCKITKLLEGTLQGSEASLESVAELDVVLPDDLQLLKPVNTPDWKDPHVVRREIEAARAGQRFAYKGNAEEKWMLFLKTTVAHPSLVIIRAHPISYQYTEASLQRFRKKHSGRFEIDDDIQSCFLFVTGSWADGGDSDDDDGGSDNGDDDDSDDDNDDNQPWKRRKVECGVLETETSIIRMYLIPNMSTKQ